MSLVATKARLAGRLLACQIAGTVCAVLVVGGFDRLRAGPSWRPFFESDLADLGVALLFALVACGLPAFCVALLILHHATASILKHLKVFCFGIPVLSLIAGLIAFPPSAHDGILWINMIPLSALCAGTVFWFWQRNKPMVPEGF